MDYLEIVKHAVIITSFVFVMMTLLEYLNILTKGSLPGLIRGENWRQNIIAGLIGVMPGCLGGFANVTLYAHRIISFGAIVGGMIAASGDEAFIMLAMFPKQAVLLFGILLFIGVPVGMLVDILLNHRKFTQPDCCMGIAFHQEESKLHFSFDAVIQEAKQGLWKRLILIVPLSIIIVNAVIEMAESHKWETEGILLGFILSFGIVMLISAPSHFLEIHIWQHVIKEHIPRIFLWTLSALLLIEILLDYFQMESLIRESPFMMLGAAVLIGFIPESGPHLFFVTLFARGTIPFSVLLASSIVQDGHGMLPMLAYSKKDFIYIKSINMITGFLIGLAVHAAGW